MADTEREAFEAWARDPIRAEKLPLEMHPNGAYKDTRTYIAFYGGKSGSAALASRPAEVDDEGLPPLPEPHWKRSESFTAEQYRQGQRDAVAAAIGEAYALLFGAYPHIPPHAVNRAIARVGPIEDAYINTRIRKFLERPAAHSHTTNKENG